MTILTRRSTMGGLQKTDLTSPYVGPELKVSQFPKAIMSGSACDDEDASELENILPNFASADYDWKCFGYLLEEANKPSTSKVEEDTKSECETGEKLVVFAKPEVVPIGKGRRRRRSSGVKTPKTNADASGGSGRKEVLNPADISLGGDTFDYSNEEAMKNDTAAEESESIASGVARRRRTSGTLSKSDDDEVASTRAVKERRLSESQMDFQMHQQSQQMHVENELERQQSPKFSPRRQEAPTVPINGEIDRNAYHCICRSLYDEKKFYVMCDMCSGWFHGRCVNVSEKQAAKMAGWTCEQCLMEERRVKESPQLYCLCRTPYDDTKFYVGCDSCQGWFHPNCVNITQKVAEEAAEYICPRCKEAELEERQNGYESSSSSESMVSRASTNLVQSDYTYVMQLLELLLEHRMSTPFQRPVNLDEFPDYTQYIKTPMDLSTIGSKVEGLEYTHLSDFVADVNLMFENAKKYNPKDHAIFKCAETMQEVFERKLLEARDSIRMNHIQSMSRRRLISEGQNTLDGSLDIETDQLIPFDPNAELQMYDY